MSSGLYHINPRTGDPGLCNAKNGRCPFGESDEHYTSSEAAREAYETKSEDAKNKALTAWKRKTKPAPAASAPTVGHGYRDRSYGHGNISGHGH